MSTAPLFCVPILGLGRYFTAEPPKVPQVFCGLATHVLEPARRVLAVATAVSLPFAVNEDDPLLFGVPQYEVGRFCTQIVANDDVRVAEFRIHAVTDSQKVNN